MVLITGVETNSHAEKSGIKKGDSLISINGNNITDVLDYRFYATEKKLDILLCRDGKQISVSVKKDMYDDLGLEFETYLMDKKHSCKNKCVFCFIDQNPPGMREDIYFKDDDSRLSFFFGNYITLTNMTEEDIDRIIKMRISPVNISVHTTNRELRVKMMNNKNAGKVLDYLDKLKDGGITMNAQIVLCKGINDGKELVKTLDDLSEYYPMIESIAVVPAGLTKHRNGLYSLEQFTKDEAKQVIEIIDNKRKENFEKYGEKLVQASDEWYLNAKLCLPCEEYYDGYPQLDNGVGGITSGRCEIEDEISYLKESGFALSEKRNISMVTGVLAFDFICETAKKVEEAFDNIKISVYKVENTFFGQTITVAGLLTGGDMYNALKGKSLGDELLIPAVTLRHDGKLFLDDMSIDTLSEKLGVSVCPVSNDGREIVRKILGIEEC